MKITITDHNKQIKDALTDVLEVNDLLAYYQSEDFDTFALEEYITDMLFSMGLKLEIESTFPTTIPAAIEIRFKNHIVATITIEQGDNNESN